MILRCGCFNTPFYDHHNQITAPYKPTVRCHYWEISWLAQSWYGQYDATIIYFGYKPQDLVWYDAIFILFYFSFNSLFIDFPYEITKL